MIYLDHNATTPVDPAVIEAMMPLLSEHFANPASAHPAGQAVARFVERARRDVAALAGAEVRDVIFTSGATEAANLAISGILAGAPHWRRRVLVAATEHRAVIAAAQAAARQHGGLVQIIGVHPDGTVDLEHLRALLRPGAGDVETPGDGHSRRPDQGIVEGAGRGGGWDADGNWHAGSVVGGSSLSEVALVAVMTANNETGALNDPRPVAMLAHEAGALYLADVTQTLGRLPVTVGESGIDLAIASAHKLYGPKGVGALIASRAVRAQLAPLLHGGSQERGLRPGTVNSAGVVGFGAAARIAAQLMDHEAQRQQALIDLLADLLVGWLGADGVERNGPAKWRLPNTINLRFPGADADAVQSCLPEVAVSAGSACHGGGNEPSHVLLAMGRTATAAQESLRFSVGRSTTVDEIHAAAAAVARAVLRVRSLDQGRSEAAWDAVDGSRFTDVRPERVPADWTPSGWSAAERISIRDLPSPRSAFHR